MSDRANRIQRWIAIGLAAVGIVAFAGWSVLPATRELSYGYASYYTAARLVRDGAETDRFYENRWFLDHSIEMGFVETPDIFFVNPPPTALLLLPFSDLSPEHADVAWTLLNVLMLVIAAAIIFDTLAVTGMHIARGSALFWAFVALIAVYNPIWENIFFGQVYVLLLLFLTLAMRAYVLDQRRRLGVWLGLMFAAKTAGGLLWGMLILDRRFRSLGWGAVTILVVLLAASPLLGFTMWWEYVDRLPGLFNQPWSGVTAYQTTTSFIHHNFHVEPRSNATPIADLPAIVAPLSTAINITIFGLAALAGWALQREMDGRRLRLARFGLMSALMVPLQPLGEEHHYVLALPSVLSALCLGLAEPAGIRRGVMLLLATIGALLIAVPLHHTHPSLGPGFRAVFAYPKLYGGLLIAGAMTVQLVIAPAEWQSRIQTLLSTLPVIRRPSQSRQSAS